MPIALPAGRNGFQPVLNLAYSTGNGNGRFGPHSGGPAMYLTTDIEKYKGIPPHASGFK